LRQIALTGGTATVETAISTSAIVPPWAQNVFAILSPTLTSATPVGNIFRFRTSAGFNWTAVPLQVEVAGNTIQDSIGALFENRAQTAYYLWDTTAGTRNGQLLVTGYTVPNGAA
jgi:hypothetical protein